MTVVVQTDFTAANGANWPSPWTTVEGGIAVASNRGQVVTAATTWSDALARANITMSDGVLLAQVQTPSVADGTSSIDFRYNTATGNGYQLSIGWYYGGFELLKVTNYSTTSIAAGSSSISWLENTAYNIRLELDGSAIRARHWPYSQTEPSAWQIETTDISYTSGDLLLRSTSNSVGNAMETLFDDVTIDNEPSVPPAESISVSLVNPTPSGLTSGYEHVSGTVELLANISDDSQVTLVEFFDGDPGTDGALISSSTVPPFAVTWNTTTATNSMHQLYARVSDQSPFQTKSGRQLVLVNNGGVWVAKNGRAWPVAVST